MNSGGGGSGGRVAIYRNESEFSGNIDARGGASDVESGGPGTIYKMIGSGEKLKRSLEINNGGLAPINEYLVSEKQHENGGKSWVEVQSQADLYYDELHLLGGAHVSFVSNVFGTIIVEKFVGDNTGMMHIQNGDEVYLKSAPIEFPSWFRVYQGGYLALPNIVHLNYFGYKELFVDGFLGYIQEFRIGTKVSVILGNDVNNLPTFSPGI